MKLTKRNKTITAIITIALTVIVIVSVNSGVVNNPPVTGEVEVPLQVKQIFERACFSCHSNKTNLSWLDKLPVVSSIVAHDVTEARKRFNFSEWDMLSPVDKKATLWEIYNMVNAGKMPLRSYTAIHPEAKISKTDLSIFKDYLNTLRVTHINDTAMAHEATIQRLQWQRQQVVAADTPHVSANGIKHMPEYRNWQVMSTTSRFDNGTMRIMYANPVAYQAIKNKNINPWPNGSVIAKVVWEKQEDSEGNVHPGKFVNIQYMVKDSDKYKDTEGWGFARFDSPKLKPYGTILSFKKCIACHQVVKKTGFVFDLSTKN